MTSRRIVLHESTQRSLCRLGFVVLGLAPLLLCAYLSMAACIPGYHGRQAARWEQELVKTFGLTFRIGEAHSLAPFRFRLDNVEISQPGTQKLIGNIRSIHLTLGANDSWNIRLETPELNLDQIADGCRTLQHHWHISRGQSMQQRATIQSDRLSISDRDDLLELSELSFEVLPDPWNLTARFKIPPAPVKKRADLQTECLLTVKRHLAATELDLSIPISSEVPCSTLAKLFDLKKPDAQLTSNLAVQSSQFSGAIHAKFHEQRVDYRLQRATISQIDMGQLSLGTETLLSGVGKLTIINAELSSSQLALATGYLEVGPGYVDSRFLQSLRFYMGFVLPRQHSLGLVGFNRMAIGFTIQPKVIELFGGLEDSHGVLALREKDNSVLPIISLVHALAFQPENPIIPGRISPLVRQALVWLPLDDNQRQQLASRDQALR